MMISCAANAEGAVVDADRLNLRLEPATSGLVVGILKEGDEVEILSDMGEWCYVSMNGREGYVMKSYLTVDGTENEDGQRPESGKSEFPAPGRTTTRVNFREEPTTKSAVLKVIPNKAEITVTGVSGEWYRAEYAGKSGYLMAEYVVLEQKDDQDGETQQPAPEKPSEKPEEEEKDEFRGPYTGETTVRVNMRKGPSTGESVVKVVSKGADVLVTGESGDWYQVEAAGREGYIFKEYVILTGAADREEEDEQPAAPEQPAEPEKPAVSTPVGTGKVTGSVNMRTEATTASAVIRVLSIGTEVEILGTSNGFCLVLHEGTLGYVSAKYISAEEEEATGEIIYPAAKYGAATVSVNMRRAPEGEIMRTLKKDAVLQLLGENGGWLKVLYQGEVGYVSAAYVEERQLTDEEIGQLPEEEPEEGGIAYVTADSLNIRKGPGTNYGVLGVLTYGDEVKYISLSDGWYMIETEEGTGYVSEKYISTDEPGSEETVNGSVILSDWYKGEVAGVFDRGDVATVTDIKTGLKFQVKRTGGYNHADAQPLTEKDTKIMYQAYGYFWQWTRRPIWVTVDGKTYAASMNGMPHGESDSMPENGFDGCFCIHFLNSRTHGTDRVDSAHQNCIQEAYKAG